MSEFEKTFEEFAELAKRRLNKGLISLALYGSVAKGTFKKDSDIDFFAVVSDEDAKEELFDISFEMGLKYGVLISVVARTEKELKEMEKIGSIYLKEIKETGRVLHGERIG